MYVSEYIARHDQRMELITKDISNLFSPSVRMNRHSFVKPSMLLSVNTPDVVVVNKKSKEVSVVELTCTFDSNLKEAFMAKVMK